MKKILLCKILLLVVLSFFATPVFAQAPWIDSLPDRPLIDPGSDNTAQWAYEWLLEEWDDKGGHIGSTHERFPETLPPGLNQSKTTREDKWYYKGFCLVDHIVYIFSHRIRVYYHNSQGEMIGYWYSEQRYVVHTTIPCSKPQEVR